jgi:hypothetical protein
VAGIFRIQVPELVQIADDTAVSFELRDGRVYHEGLVFLLPELSRDIEWRSSGTVGLDETLDLRLQAQLPLDMLHDGPLMRSLSQRPLEFKVVGTLSKPKVELFRDGGWLQELIDLAGGEDAEAGAGEPEAIAESVLGIVGDALNELQSLDVQNRPTPLLDRLRQRAAARQEANADQGDAAEPSGEQTPPQAEPKPRPRLFPRLFRRRKPAPDAAAPPE